MIYSTPIDAPTPPELWDMLVKHNLVTGALRANPGSGVGMAQSGAFSVWHDEAEALALVALFRTGEPGVLELFIVPESRTFGKERRAEICELAPSLRQEWFSNGVRRVQCQVPASRVNTHRILKALGFIEETKRNCGLRNYIALGDHYEAMSVFGLLESDPLCQYVDMANAVNED